MKRGEGGSLAARTAIDAVGREDGATGHVGGPVAHLEGGVEVQGGGAFFDKGHAPVALNEQLAVVGVGLQRVRSGTVEGCNRGTSTQTVMTMDIMITIMTFN